MEILLLNTRRINHMEIKGTTTGLAPSERTHLIECTHLIERTHLIKPATEMTRLMNLHYSMKEWTIMTRLMKGRKSGAGRMATEAGEMTDITNNVTSIVIGKQGIPTVIATSGCALCTLFVENLLVSVTYCNF